MSDAQITVAGEEEHPEEGVSPSELASLKLECLQLANHRHAMRPAADHPTTTELIEDAQKLVDFCLKNGAALARAALDDEPEADEAA